LIDGNELSLAIGTDIVEIDRFRSLEPGSPFYRRTFSAKELAYCFGFTDPYPHIAATFAGKEAVLKATNSNCELSLDDIEILRDEEGAPYVTHYRKCNHEIYISLSHSSSHAVAVALAAHKTNVSNTDEIQRLLEATIEQILPRGNV
jgi:holo-[acyl-carrier protein] synthase